MNILTFDYEYPPVGGGGGVVHAHIAEELARRHRVAVVTSSYGDLPRREERSGVEVYRVPVWGRNGRSAASLTSLLTYPVAAWVRAAKLIRAGRWDVVNGHFAIPTGPGSLPPALAAHIPHVISIHGGDVYDPSKSLSPHRVAPLRWTVRAVLEGSRAVVAQSTNTRDNVRRYTGYRGPVEIIPLGIRRHRAVPASRRELGLPERAFLAVTVGRLVARKGVDALVRCLARPELERVHLVVLGDGPEREPLERLVADLGLSSRITFGGFVEEERKWQVLQVSDLYASATLHEGFGLVFLEAMMTGLPVVTYDHGGHTDFLVDGKTGFLVPVGNEDELAAALGRLASHPEEARRLGQSGFQRSDAYRIERCAEAYEQLFETVLTGSSTSDGAAAAPAVGSRP